jgi:predicted ABC-type exoprotein transport system permease subunit
LSQLFFYTQKEQKQKLYASIKLRLIIISFFFLGGIIGGVFYYSIKLYVLGIAGVTLLVAVFYDTLKLKAILFKRKRRKV